MSVSKRKFPEMILSTCEDCPYFILDYGACSPDRYVCYNPKKEYSTIMTRWRFEQLQKDRTMKMPIPNDCPLEKVAEKWHETIAGTVKVIEE
jgi:hypothetical protein